MKNYTDCLFSSLTKSCAFTLVFHFTTKRKSHYIGDLVVTFLISWMGFFKKKRVENKSRVVECAVSTSWVPWNWFQF